MGRSIRCNFELIDELLSKAHSLKHTLSADGVIKLQKSQQEGMELQSLEAVASHRGCGTSLAAWQSSELRTEPAPGAENSSARLPGARR